MPYKTWKIGFVARNLLAMLVVIVVCLGGSLLILGGIFH